MNSDRIGRWLTLGANLAVLAGIILILLELNQNADLMRAQMIQARTDQTTSKYDSMIHSDYWAAIWAKRRSATSEREWIALLTPEEFERVQYYYFREYEDLRGQYFQYLEGYVTEQYWDSAIRTQVERLIDLAVGLEVKWDTEMQKDAFRSEVIEIARQTGRGSLNSEGVWE